MSPFAVIRAHRSTLSGVALVILALAIVTTGKAEANHQPADKVVASAAINDIEFVTPGQSVELLSETFRTSTTSDLLLQISSECSITTEVTTVGDDAQAARGQLKYFLTISTDGGEPRPIGVTSESTSTTTSENRDEGEVVFCERKYERETSLFGEDDQDHTIRTFMETRSANAFNWVELNAGRGVHTVTLWATYDDTGTTTDQTAIGVVGRRTMIIEPVKMKNDEHVNDVVVD